MKIENQVCTYKQAKRLRALGINVPAYYIWWKDWRYEQIVLRPYSSPGYSLGGAEKEKTSAWAYSVTEIGVMLPDEIKREGALLFHWSDNCFGEGVRLHFPNLYKPEIQGGYESEAECRADTLIYLIENNYITAAECNERLQAA